LKYLDQLFEVVDLVLVVQLDLVELDSVVVGYVGHLPQSSVLSDEIFHLVRKSIDFSDQLDVFLAFTVLFLPQNIDPSDGVFGIDITRVESKILIKALNLVKKKLLVIRKLDDGLVHQLFLLLEGLVLSFCS
jgi:hypothetical protein